MLTNFYPKAGSSAVYAERYVLSFVFLFLAWHDHLRSLDWAVYAGTGSVAFVAAVRHVIMLLLDLLIGVTLLMGRRPAVLPQNLEEMLVPLAATFYFLTYNTIPWFPQPFQKNLCPPHLQVPLAVAGLVLGVVGPAISTWGVVYLGRSFGIFVMVRNVVLRGPYQYVRHPMYLGYVCICAGLVLANFSVAIFVLVPVHIFLFIYRARLEEARLSEYSVEYREYMKRTGFIFPRLRPRVGIGPEAR